MLKQNESLSNVFTKIFDTLFTFFQNSAVSIPYELITYAVVFTAAVSTH